MIDCLVQSEWDNQVRHAFLKLFFNKNETKRVRESF
jgi:hypothetical protein